MIEQPFDQRAVKDIKDTASAASAGIGGSSRWIRPTAARISNCSLTASRRTARSGSTARRWHHNWRRLFTRFTSISRRWRVMARCLNTIAVRVDANDMEGWWYEGGGIYRHTWLVKRSPVHIMTDGVYANPVKGGGWAMDDPCRSHAGEFRHGDVRGERGGFRCSILHGRKVAGGRSAAADARSMEAGGGEAPDLRCLRRSFGRSNKPTCTTVRDESDQRRQADGRRQHDLRFPHHSLRCEGGFLPQRTAAEDPGCVLSSGSCGCWRGGAGFALGIPHSQVEGNGSQRLSHCAQSAIQGISR